MAREDYNLYKKLLLELHKMNLDGTDQTDQADVIRDQMDAPGYRMSEEEAERLQGLSADLYMITGEEVKEKSVPPLTDDEIERSFNSEDCDRVLEVLRKEDFRVPRIPEIEEHGLAYLRALAWFKLEEFDVSILFAEYAEKLKPENSSYRDLVLLNKLKLGRLGRDTSPIRSTKSLLQNAYHEMGHLQSA